MESKYSKYYFNHLLFYLEPSVFIIPFAFWINKSAIQFSCLWFGVVWYYKKQVEDM